MDPLSRRKFLKAVALSLPAATIAGCHGSADARDDLAGATNAAGPAFLSDEEQRFLEAATERLIPGDANGPGAMQAGVTRFIDLQLNGPYGVAQTWYMRGPWRDGTEQQGYQSKLTPAQLYRTAIRNIQDHCQHAYRKRFEELPPATQDEILHGLETGSITLADAPSKTFFGMLWQNTQEGYLADPMYGGNRDFAGWKLIGFPGPRYNYVAEIGQFGKPYTLPTVGLKGRGRGS